MDVPEGVIILVSRNVAAIVKVASGEIKMNVLIYARVNQKSKPLDGQIGFLREYCASCGYHVAGEATDICAGTALGNALMEALDRNDVDAIVVKSADRISRDTQKLFWFLGEMKRRKMRLIAADMVGQKTDIGGLVKQFARATCSESF